ncbi:cell division protein SepF [Candidatus Bathyarchaeota archaeon]|nr:cell division protein SepF [Candidatus Bathyarchaeota archaeon]
MTNPNLEKVIERIIGKRREEGNKAEMEEEKPVMQETAQKTAGKIYLKALSLHSLDELDKIKDEVRSGNILIVKVEPLAEKSIEDVKRAIGELSEFVESIGGDIARLGEERIVLTPSSVQIWKKKQTGSK